MSRKKTVSDSDVQIMNNPQVDMTDDREKVDKDIEYFRELYSVSDEPFVCKLHRVLKNDFGNEKYIFLNEFTQVPAEKDIAENYGGGDFSLMFYKREGPRGGLKIKEKVRFSVDNIWNKEPERGNNGIATEQPRADNGIDQFLNQAKVYKELLYNGQNNGEQTMFQMMMQMQTSLMTVMIELVKSSGKSDNKLLETILPTLLSKSLEKQNVVNDIENIAKLKEIFPGEGGTDWTSALIQALPLLFQMSNQNTPAPARHIPAHHSSAAVFDPTELKKVIKESILEIDEELRQEEDPSEEDIRETSTPLELVKEKHNDSEIESDNQKIEETNMNIKAQVNMIKKAPRSAQNEVLKMWLSMKPAKEVMAFCIDTELVKDQEEFITRCEESGVNDIKKQLE